jgi:hypothetical protein
MTAANPIIIDQTQALFCTWLQLYKALEPLHQGNQADINRLHDVWLDGVPSPQYKVAVPGKVFDERHPRQGDYLVHIVSPLNLAKWIQEVSARRGFPYSERQSLSIALGQEDYGF